MKKLGRKTKYKPKYVKMMYEFFNRPPFDVKIERITKKDGSIVEKEIKIPCALPTFKLFAQHIQVHIDTLQEWKKRHKDFSVCYKQCMTFEENIWLHNSLNGSYTTPFSIFMGKNVFGWKDTSQQDNKETKTIIIKKVTYQDDK